MYISVGEHTSMTKSVEEVKLTKTAKSKDARALQAEERTNAMIALAKKRGKLEGKEVRRECMEQDEARRLAVSCGHM
jgi:hypothetical protein